MRADLQLVADVIGATRGPSGLSGATPAYPAEYLMDNVEARRGLEDYAGLLRTVLDDPAAAERRAAEAARIADAIEAHLWAASRTGGMYGWAADELDPSWDVWFPDSVAQVWPVFDGLGDDRRRRDLWAAFDRRWPMWTRSTPGLRHGGGRARPERRHRLRRGADRRPGRGGRVPAQQRAALGRARPAAAVDGGRRRLPRAGGLHDGRPGRRDP